MHRFTVHGDLQRRWPYGRYIVRCRVTGARRKLQQQTHSVLTESSRYMIRERLRKIGENTPVARLDEGFDRHAWDDLHPAEPIPLAFGKGDPNRKVLHAGALIDDDIARNHADDTLQLRSRALVQGGKAKHCVLSRLQLVDILRRDLGLDRKIVTVGHDQHQLVARVRTTPPIVCTFD